MESQAGASGNSVRREGNDPPPSPVPQVRKRKKPGRFKKASVGRIESDGGPSGISAEASRIGRVAPSASPAEASRIERVAPSASKHTVARQTDADDSAATVREWRCSNRDFTHTFIST